MPTLPRAPPTGRPHTPLTRPRTNLPASPSLRPKTMRKPESAKALSEFKVACDYWQRPSAWPDLAS
jgi:hypothetical protein